ncbi:MULTISPECIES: putative glycoside hydrolase [Gordonia]|uniref:Glycoside hydrolase family 15 protein n=1 Tax=Gordonia tangerina TaxID=2911060 RepID=A0ABS9DNG8_9ACTN|nr:putative glycoside hydrolase [Gordonia tangerina]MCF3940147.1 putative glycoside hydrolase family 15 protein [Gordonia tangerina]
MTGGSAGGRERRTPIGLLRDRGGRSGGLRNRAYWACGVVLVVVLVLAVVLALNRDPGDAARDPASKTLSPAAASTPVFPRTATYVLDQEGLPGIETLARYDIVIIDAEWQNRLPRSFFARLRAANPGMMLLAYVNLIDSMPRTGSPEYWANAYSLWQFTDSTTRNFPPQWVARTAAGEVVHEWRDYPMVNLTDEAPRVNGQIYAEYAAHWVADRIWSTGLWDGVFLDVWGDRIYTADSDAWDIDRDGNDEPASQIYGPGKPLDRGLTIAERVMRQAMPEAILVANGDRAISGDRLNGRVFESFADPRKDPERDELVEWSKYMTAQTEEGLRSPVTGITIDSRGSVAAGSAEDLRRARLFLTATLMQNAWWAPMGEDYGEVAYYDEMDGGGLGRGYLGHALDADPTLEQMTRSSTDGTGSPAPDVFRRDFEHGIAVVNLGDEVQTISLEQPYRHLRGSQDPVVNDGSVVRSVTVPPDDGVILLRTE